MQKVMRKDYEQLHANKVDNLEETYKFLETYSLPKLSLEQTDNVNRSITRSDTDAAI